MKNLMLCGLLFISLTLPTSCGAALENLVDVAKTFSGTIRAQLETVESAPSAAELAEATISYSEAKADYYKLFAASMPELLEIVAGREPRPPEVDEIAEAFELAGENQEKEADQGTLDLLNQFADSPGTEKARIEFEAAQKIEATFEKETWRNGATSAIIET